ncbi:hypothetical protein FI667_g7243, partial [Globisporangium splendens]
MKSPTAYGSENEETSFIRRIATLDRAGSSRKQKNRLAVAGATIGLIAASAVIGYTALRGGSVGEVSIPTEQLEASTHAAAANSQFVTPLDDSFYPSLEQLDADQDGAVSQTEYLNFLEKKKDADIAEVEAANLPKDIADDLIDKINANFDVDGPCVVRAMRRANKMTIREENLKLLFYFLDEFCPTTAVNANQKLVDQHNREGLTQPPLVVETPSSTEVIGIPVVEEGEPSTTIVIDTPSSPTEVEVPVVTDDNMPTDEIVVETPSGPMVIEVPAETSAPETTVVVDTPSGPVATVEIPVVTDENMPTDNIVVETPSGPMVIEVPVVPDTPVVTPAPDNSWMTKKQFKQQIGSYFAAEVKEP